MQFDVSATGPFWAALRLAHLGAGEYPRKELCCPRCLLHDCAPSLPAGWRDRFFERRGRYPYQCRVCGKRFYYYKGTAAGSRQNQH